MHELVEEDLDVGRVLRHQRLNGVLAGWLAVGPGHLGLGQLRSLAGRWVLDGQGDHIGI